MALLAQGARLLTSGMSVMYTLTAVGLAKVTVAPGLQYALSTWQSVSTVPGGM
jgi:hypothetical protein